MPFYDCRLGSPSGKMIKESFEAVSAEALRARLRNEGFHVIALRRRFSFFAGGGKKDSGRISSRQFLTFNQEMLVLLRSGLPMLQVLDATLERLDAGPLQRSVQQVREAVKGGASLSSAFGQFPRYFPYLYLAALQAGEQTGDLAVTIQRYVNYQKRIGQVKNKVKMAAFYPAMLCLAAIGILVFMVLFVVPRFAEIFRDAKLDLPWVTRLLITLADLLTGHFLWLVPIVLLSPVMLRHIRVNSGLRVIVDYWKLKLVFVGPLFLEYSLLNFTRTLATLMSSGIPLLPAMRMSRKTLNNRYLENHLEQAAERITEGKTPASALEEAGFFPSLALRMVKAGERSGALQEMLLEVAGYYEDQVEERLWRLSSMIEPLMMLLIGLLIGGVVVAMYIPIFQLASAA
ncbi:type II secretion system inner membrane protein PulF [Syntrophotalea carbinolica DSM 2380]|uniref:Type II secretion system inner membrane protein PulF n=1 Tax=Syntrophotalea carbinolica (strain DSM 2380 / NBRC 103641 / GraBd1) TaxID=338963 RepID=Q3A8A0_SYNC1|nr:type II secretion system F family protein [Syntrophotalea carbinolica]ABA87392.1 type II secretion system inner membrane protein PulF [Syntrophotalea carbinolica DSM 2380]